MASNSEDIQSRDLLEKKVYDIPGEPATVIDGVPLPPNMDGSDPQVVASKSDSEVCLDFEKWMEGRAIKKLFGEQFYTGTVTSFDTKTEWYRVVYEDGDFEDLEWHELEQILVPVDINVPLETLALKRVENKNEMHAHKTTENQLGSRGRKAAINKGKTCKD
ncbi:hypothetical protein AQUCO_01700598v1 [Aquilegia coerulea]|uniref:PTM/DIR17-like Tudor domain-containing protein n=1 Tax=Aquilegia coerulea TaxID=218851 RepID=A0A2G5DPK1_AQUCA|nr:hypothetical protein AQUCO_01700598v1 [Aquilegia coerulea]